MWLGYLPPCSLSLLSRTSTDLTANLFIRLPDQKYRNCIYFHFSIIYPHPLISLFPFLPDYKPTSFIGPKWFQYTGSLSYSHTQQLGTASSLLWPTRPTQHRQGLSLRHPLASSLFFAQATQPVFSPKNSWSVFPIQADAKRLFSDVFIWWTPPVTSQIKSHPLRKAFLDYPLQHRTPPPVTFLATILLYFFLTMTSYYYTDYIKQSIVYGSQ